MLGLVTTQPKVKAPPAPPVRLKKDSLWRSMLTRTEVTIQDHTDRRFYTGIVNNVGVEDGSGSSFLVTLSTGQKLWHRTSD